MLESKIMDEDGCAGWIFLLIIGGIVWFAWLDDSKIRYEFEYSGAELEIVDKPHDCDFLTAPMGMKNCSYQKKVNIHFYSKFPPSSGDMFGPINDPWDSENLIPGAPIVSFNNGKTWLFNRGGPMRGKLVMISWSRTND